MTKMTYLNAIREIERLSDKTISASPKFGYARACGALENVLALALSEMDEERAMDLIDLLDQPTPGLSNA